ncbi:MAG: hypothetical protein CR972_02385 [Candidatus Moraniibacteriota bacterium]|nr:MAG: hypothetical protein CR972_02385 [Candidatus Moranbacteria bacterium]
MNEKKLQKFQYDPKGFIFFAARQKVCLGIIIFICVIIARGVYTIVPFISKQITDLLTHFSGNYDDLYRLIFLLLIAMIVSMLIYRITGIIATIWIPYIEKYAAQISFDYLMRHGAQYFSNRLSGKLQNKIFNISQAIHNIFPIIFWNLTDLCVKLFFSIFLAFTVHFYVGCVFLIFSAITVIYSIFVSRKLAKYSQICAESASESRGVMIDVISNILAVKQNVALERESHNVDSALEDYRRKSQKNWNFFEWSLLFNNIIILTMFFVVLIVSVHFLREGVATPGDIVMLLVIMMGLYGELQFLSMSLNRFMEQYGQLREGLEEVFAPFDIVDRSYECKDGKMSKGDILFDHINFKYEDDDSQAVFKDLSFSIPSGQKVGLVGESGAGKSTFVNLLLRFVEPNDGVILIDGCDISKIKQDTLRNVVAYVPQDSMLFHRTLQDNIKYSDPHVSDEEMIIATKRAHAEKFIEDLPKKYNTLVGERGVKLSGGQKQRVMIARAMLKKSPILVLDEATSALDSESEKLIQDALEKLMEDRTTIVIAHRLSTLKKMDRIVVFDNGKIIEDGTHKELLEKRGKYYDLWQYQTGEM